MNEKKIKQNELKICLFQDISDKIDDLRKKGTKDEKIDYLNALKESHSKELKIKKDKIFNRVSIDKDIDVIQENAKDYIIKLTEGKEIWYKSDINQLILSLVTYIGFAITFICFGFTISSINTVNKELDNQWNVVNRTNLIQRQIELLNRTNHMSKYITYDDLESLMNYIKESDIYLRKNQKNKYTKRYKKQFEKVYKKGKDIWNDFTEIKKEDYINCLKDMEIQFKK